MQHEVGTRRELVTLNTNCTDDEVSKAETELAWARHKWENG